MKMLIIIVIFSSCTSQLSKYQTGIIDQKNLLEESKWFKPYKSYQVSEKEKVGEMFQFTIIFGLWCHDSKREIPKLLKTFSELSIPEKSVSLVAIDRKKTTPLDSIKKYKIHFTPTIIVKYHGKEVERFVEYPHSKWEADIIKLYHKYNERSID